ncbi:hypothetical protein BDB01DRAFT_773883 [Pilobolus umbonatus]|nr:hypothetical protein BDB01DRAFT_773883 [Pilobolus umbonatus]
MTTEEDRLHVVIRLPFKRPEGFIETPSIVWTDEMEQKLWQHMSQKDTDWEAISEQLGVPKAYLVRHAAFIYERQLRGIHQHLRSNVSSNSINRANVRSPVPSKGRPVSVRYSDTFQLHPQSSPPQAVQSIPQQMYQSPAPLTQHSIHQTSQLLSHPQLIQSQLLSHPQLIQSQLLQPQSSSMHSIPPNSFTPTTKAVLGNESIVLPDQSHHANNTSSDDYNTLIPSTFLHRYTNYPNYDPHEDGSGSPCESDRDEDGQFSTQFERMKLEVEKPAFMTRKSETISPTKPSVSTQRKDAAESSIRLNPVSYSPATNTVNNSNNTSAINSVGSSFSDLSDSSVTQSALEDAFMSKFNNGSKMSILNFSRRYN